MYPSSCDGILCEWWICQNTISQDPCYSGSGGFIHNRLRKECPHHYNISDINEQWSEIPETIPGNDGSDFVQSPGRDQNLFKNGQVRFGMHLQYLVDAAEKFLIEEHAIVEDYVLGRFKDYS